MPIEQNAHGYYPKISRTAFIHPTAVLIGNVRVGKNVFVGPYAVIRADEPTKQNQVMPVVINDNSNIQDNVVIHALAGSEVVIGRKTSISHGALIHGPAAIGKNCFVGFKSIVFRSILEDNTIMLHAALVENSLIPKNHSIPSSISIRSEQDLDQLVKIDKNLRAFADNIVVTNLNLTQNYRRQRKPG